MLCIRSIGLLLAAIIVSTFSLHATDGHASLLSRKIARFSTSLQNEVAKVKPNENVIISPFSVEALLALLSLGTEGQTHEELLRALDFPSDAFIRTSFKQVSDSLRDVKGVTLAMANKIFVKRGRQRLLTQFKHDSLYVFHTGIRLQNFLNRVASANAVNSWVESKTNHHITNLFSANDFDKYTRVVLVNAVYFKGSWKEKFNKALTTSRPFYTSSGTEVQVPNMQITSKFRYIRDWQHDIELLELPFEGDDMSMVLVLPSQVGGLPALQAKLATELNIQDLIANMLTEIVSVSIPKFKIETSVDLMKVLQKIGVNLIFDGDNSQLTKVTPERLYITKAMQKAFIEVNEDGAEVTAATGFIAAGPSSALSDTKMFYANSPFAFFLLHGDRVLFTGCVNNFE